MTIYADALKHARSGEGSKWHEAGAIRLALSKGGTIREYALLRDKNWKSEQRYSNWVVAVEFREEAGKAFEREVSQLAQVGLTFITYWAEVGRYWKSGADIQDCVELLRDCVVQDGGEVRFKGADWLRSKINEVVSPAPDWRVRVKKLYSAIYDVLYGGATDEDVPHGLLALLRSVEGLLKPMLTEKVAK